MVTDLFFLIIVFLGSTIMVSLKVLASHGRREDDGHGIGSSGGAAGGGCRKW